MLISFIAVLAYILVNIFTRTSVSNAEALTFTSQFSSASLHSMGLYSAWDKFVFCVNILAGSAGALALIDADLGRYSRSSKDIGIAAALGNLSLDVIMVIVGAVIMFAGMPMLVEYYVNTEGLAASEAQRIAIENPDRIAAAFVIFSGILGAILMFVAQSKAQVLNTYSSSLSMANLMDALLGWRPGRFFFVIAVNALSMLFLYGEIIAWFNAFLVVLGILTTCFAAIMIADYFIVAKIDPSLIRQSANQEQFNWAGIISIAIGFTLAHYVLIGVNPIEFLTAVVISFTVYPLLRTTICRPSTQ